MAIDHALAACLGEGEAVLRLYGWARPTVSFGRNEPARGLYGSPPWARARPAPAPASPSAPPSTSVPDPLGFVRRPTGGRAVVHGRELTYAVVAPLHAWGGLRAAYVAINEALAGALAALGVPVEVAQGAQPAGAGPLAASVGVAPPAGVGGAVPAAGTRAAASALRPDAGPCFQSPAPGEVVAAGRKLVGSAQARLQGALLQHGSILLDDDQAMLEELAGGGGRAGGDGSPSGGGGSWAGGPGAGRPATLRELVGDVGIDELAELVAMSLRETFGGRWAPGAYRPSEIETAERLERERYAQDSWTWRR
jgi:lipoate-protein ligase A